ncbi:D-sedoheptulose-7-phosphate isomerase [Facilibium subflavum]|uniref:D-sedoheptulose-7-phosphate isomerase n=1 Tax=Facilibium subflavum TaxID=2219058 RepID=UPI000E64A8E8|nr:SIS domain-containing protein [Facilibium subflavum]
MNLTKRIQNHFSESIQTQIMIADTMAEQIINSGQIIVDAILNSKKVLICGNGGAAANAQHFSAQLLNRFEMERPSLPAIALSSNAVTITSIAADTTFDCVFSKQINALGHEHDVLVTLSFDGNDQSLIEAIKTAQEKNMQIISITGKDGGKIRTLLSRQDIELCVPSDSTARIQESHTTIIHCLSDMVDMCLFGA